MISQERITGVIRLNQKTIRIPSEGVREYLKGCEINGPEFNPDDLDDRRSEAIVQSPPCPPQRHR
jgi:hypothetical protein